MSVSKEMHGAARQGVPPVLHVEGEMTVYRAAELKNLLLGTLHDVAELDIDLDAVTEIDTAGLQLLLLTQRDADARGIRVRFTGRSAAVGEAAELLGLTGSLFADAPGPALVDAADACACGSPA